MRLATFNLESLDMDSSGSATPAERFSILRPQLNRLEADVLCLQEVNGQKTPGKHERSLAVLDALLDGTPYEQYHRFSTTGPKGVGVGDVHNLVVLSPYAIIDAKEIRHTLVDPPAYRQATARPPQGSAQDVTWDRPFLAVTLELSDARHLHVVNTHLRAPLAAPIAGQKISPFVWRTVSGWAEGYFISGMKRLGQALEIRMHADRILNKESDSLIAICGDFNAEDHNAAINIIAGAEEDTGNGQLAGYSLAQVDRSLSEDRRFSVLHHGRPQMLDHIFASRALFGWFRHAEIHNEMLEDEAVGFAKVDRSPDSYHAPLVAEFSLDD